jgi:hypothetical protein
MTPSPLPPGRRPVRALAKSAWSPNAAPSPLPRNSRRHPERRRPSAAGGICRTTTQLAKAGAAGDLSLRLKPGCAQDDALVLPPGTVTQSAWSPSPRRHPSRRPHNSRVISGVIPNGGVLQPPEGSAGEAVAVGARTPSFQGPTGGSREAFLPDSLPVSGRLRAGVP